MATLMINRNPKLSFLNVPCPECGHTTDEGMCYNSRCKVGWYNIQVELGREIPEDWLMVEVEPAATGSFSNAVDLDSITFPERVAA